MHVAFAVLCAIPLVATSLDTYLDTYPLLSLFSFLCYILFIQMCVANNAFFSPNSTPTLTFQMLFVCTPYYQPSSNNIDPSQYQCWKNTGDIGPTSNERWVSVPSQSTMHTLLSVHCSRTILKLPN